MIIEKVKVERIKTVVLVFLVFLSLLLTYKLWFGLSIYEETAYPSYERFYFGYPRAMSEVIQPQEIIVFQNSDIYRFGPAETMHFMLWESILPFLADPDAKIYPFDEEPIEEQKILLYRFNTPFPLEEYHAQLVEMHVAEIEVHQHDEKGYYFLLNDIEGKLYIMYAEQKFQGIALLLEEICKDAYSQYELLRWPASEDGETLNIEIKGDFFVPCEEVYFGDLKVRPEDFDVDKMLKSFFVNEALVRRIEERDGSIIFTDGERGLRFFSNGLEFNAPRVKKNVVNLTYSNVLHKISDYINLHGGWTSSLYITHIGIEGTDFDGKECYVVEGYVFYRGLPLLNKPPALRILLGDQGVSNYTRLVATPHQEASAIQPIIPAVDAIKKAVKKYQEYLPGQKNITVTDIILVYSYLNEEKNCYSPVWIVQFEDQFSFYIDAHSGELVSQIF